MNRIVKLIVGSILMCLLISRSVGSIDTTVGTLNIPEEPTPFWSEAIDIWIVDVGQFGCLMASFDLDGDGEEDYQTQREILPNAKVWPYPIYYFVDIDGHQAINPETEWWVDVPPDGDTSNAVLYPEYQRRLAAEQPTDYDKLLKDSFW